VVFILGLSTQRSLSQSNETKHAHGAKHCDFDIVDAAAEHFLSPLSKDTVPFRLIRMSRGTVTLFGS
jgi:hypothetical protein